MTKEEIKIRQAAIDCFTDKATNACFSGAFLVAMLIASLLGYEAFVV